MRRLNTAAALWLFLGLAFVVAAVFADRRQPALLAAAIVSFAASIVTIRRSRRTREE